MKQVRKGVVLRREDLHVFEVDPALMSRVPQDVTDIEQARIVKNRWEYLDWMHRHFAHKTVLLSEVTAAPSQGPGQAGH
ncbi:MAG: hypothetical protein RMK01_02330 [Thermomicrobium sp.]|nr:hypothetical protein [Thermomicrobium sp.]MDW8058894.1 hypothetical protein [Thermomicrobium sp.]